MEGHHNILAAVRNPLSIIALFVLFIEVIATVAMSNTLLTDAQRNWLVVLCAIYPALVLVVFFLLAWYRPINFYGPQDYSDDNIFLKLMKQEKILDEVEEVYQARDESGSESRMAIVSQIKRAERKALDELQLEFHSPLLHEARSSVIDYCFDGVIKRGKRWLYIEVKFISNGLISTSLLASIKRFVIAAGDGDKLLAIVTREPLSEERRLEIGKMIERVSPGVQIRFYVL